MGKDATMAAGLMIDDKRYRNVHFQLMNQIHQRFVIPILTSEILNLAWKQSQNLRAIVLDKNCPPFPITLRKSATGTG